MAAPVIRWATTPSDGSVGAAIDLGVNCDTVKVLNRDAAVDIWVCLDGKGGPAADGIPTVEGNDTELVPAGCERTLASPGGSNTTIKVRAGANSAVKFGVRGTPQ